MFCLWCLVTTDTAGDVNTVSLNTVFHPDYPSRVFLATYTAGNYPYSASASASVTPVDIVDDEPHETISMRQYIWGIFLTSPALFVETKKKKV